jgi:hydrogenase 3 maturation protease
VVEFSDKLKGKVLILGIGNLLKRDDGIGPHFVRKFEVRSPKSETIDAGSAPENYTGKIRQLKPDTLVIVDAVDFGEKPGNIRIVEEEKIKTQSLSTHSISLKTFIDFIKADLPDLKVVLVGIQPKEVNFGEGLSPEVEKAVDELCTSLV